MRGYNSTWKISGISTIIIGSRGRTREIVLKKYEPADIFTGSMDDLIDYKGKKVSKETIKELAILAGFNISNG